jgi:CheY-like chemotaxis protein
VKILLIEDSQVDRKLLITTLRKAGIENEILQATNGEAGLDILKSNATDVCIVLVDGVMPRVGGLEFLRGVNKDPELANVPVVMISAAGAEESKEIAKLLHPRLAGYLVKPLTKKELLETISPYLK